MRRLVVAVLCACGKTTSTPAAPALADASVVVAPVGAEAPPPRVLAAPPGTDAELVTIAASICAAAYRVDDGKKILGCRKPPPFDRKGRGPDGTFPEHTADPTTFCPFEVLARGAFTREKADQIALRFDACHEEGETWDAGMPGSVVVVERARAGYRVARTVLDVNTGRCMPITSFGRTAFVCQSGFGAPAIGGMTYWFHLDFDADPAARTFLRLYDDATLFSCAAHENEAKLAPTGLVDVAPIAAEVVDPGDGVHAGMRIAVDIERARVEPSAALEVRLRALCKKGDVTPALPPKKRFRLEFTNDGAGFKPAPTTAGLLADWEKQTPDVQQLRAASPP